MTLDPATLRRLRRALDRACPAGIDPLDWRRLREAILEPARFATATGQPWPAEGYAHLPGPSRDEAFTRPDDPPPARPGGRPFAPIDHLDI